MPGSAREYTYIQRHRFHLYFAISLTAFDCHGYARDTANDIQIKSFVARGEEMFSYPPRLALTGRGKLYARPGTLSRVGKIVLGIEEEREDSLVSSRATERYARRKIKLGNTRCEIKMRTLDTFEMRTFRE